jgi:4'-phosphopantetheinyl transferase
MRLFIYEGNIKKTDTLVREALCVYAAKEGLDISEEAALNAKIERTENGKPFFPDIENVHFSVSHSGQMWICLMADSCVGIDIQEMKHGRYKEIADRYFGPHEDHFVALWGDEGFIDLWVRKESIVKYKGSTLARDIRNEVAVNGDLKDEMEIDGKTVYLETIDMGLDVKCAYACEKKEELCIEILA